MNRRTFLPVLCLSLLVAACHDHHHDQRIVVTNGDYHMDIKREGQVEFTEDTTAIKSISPGGYVSFIRNDKRLIAEYDEKEGVYLEMYAKDTLLPRGEGAAFLAEAVKEMVERNVGPVYRKN